MAVRLAVRGLPPDATPALLDARIAEAGFSLQTDRIVIQRIANGKVATSTKAEVPSTGFVTVGNALTAARLVKKFATPPVKCELTTIQRVPDRLVVLPGAGKKPSASAQSDNSAASTQHSAAGTWKSDPLFAKFQGLNQPQPKQKVGGDSTLLSTSEQGQSSSNSKEVTVAPLVAHIRKELLAKRNKQQKAQKEQRKRKTPAATSASTSKAATPEQASSAKAAPPVKEKRSKPPKKPAGVSETAEGGSKSGDGKRRPADVKQAG